MNAWDFVDTMLAEAEKANEPCSFSPAQVIKLRQMIAEIPTDSLKSKNGRNRARATRTGEKGYAQTVRFPESLYKQLHKKSEQQDVSFSALVIEACKDYMERTD